MESEPTGAALWAVKFGEVMHRVCFYHTIAAARDK